MNLSRLSKLRRLAALCFATASLIPLMGCRGAPSINVLGSFFPGWMLCVGLGVGGTIFLRHVFVRIGMESYLGPRPVIYFCLWLLITLASWLLFFRS
jgi:hypothetical protein